MKLGNKPRVREGNIIYMLVGLTLLALGGYAQSKSYELGILITQFGIILLPALIYTASKSYSIVETFRLNRTSFKNIVLSVFIVIFSYPIAVFFNLIGMILISNFGSLVENPIQMPTSRLDLLKSFLLVAVSPAICEEFLFRGFLMTSYENLGKFRSIIYSALLFGVFHFNLQNLLGPIVLGIVFGFMVRRTNSLLPSMVGHMTNNSIALVLGYRMNRMSPGDMDLAVGDISLSLESVGPALMFLGIIAILSSIILISLIRQLDEGDREGYRLIEINDDNVLMIREVEDLGLIDLLPVLLILLVYIVYNYRIFFV